MLGMQVEVSNSLASTVVKSMELVADSPRPQNCHSVQFARLLLGHTNTCITLLNAVQNHKVRLLLACLGDFTSVNKKMMIQQAVLLVSETSLAPWIQYLQDFGGENSKVASALSDRAFRILWKCAATIDNAKGKQTQKLGAALPLRSTALSFLLKCSNYTPSYFIQQVTYRSNADIFD
ncbi:unnamed protein product [Phytophthora lilii]|uniref:Unnamed protein product n=1 Tax=Phytophthora lilii TaxID=2077276 RepID=A0A9W6UCZ2_9STRA|nr:unnamed protein product [Phytophthora lilii]